MKKRRGDWGRERRDRKGREDIIIIINKERNRREI